MGERERAFHLVETQRLVLRRPHGSDLPAVFAIHADPATNTYNPAGPDADLATSAQRLQEWLDHWAEHGFGYWTVMAKGAEDAIGFAGIRHDTWLDRPILNLYYRFGRAAWGRGYATEAARQAVVLAERFFPQLPVVARTKLENVPSQRTAIAVGLTRRPDLDRHDATGPAVILAKWWPNRSKVPTR